MFCSGVVVDPEPLLHRQVFIAAPSCFDSYCPLELIFDTFFFKRKYIVWYDRWYSELYLGGTLYLIS